MGSTPFNMYLSCVTLQSYVVLVKTLGGLWLERNLPLFMDHVLGLVASPKATQTHVDAVYSRRCVTFILQATLGQLLGEKAQVSACKELCRVITKHMNTVGEFRVLYTQRRAACHKNDLGVSCGNVT